ncbi:MAG: acyloxyacyl hydrolase [Bacteroidales bacterium]
MKKSPEIRIAVSCGILPRLIFLVGLCIFCCGLTYADSIPRKTPYVGVRAHYGFIIQHAGKVQAVSGSLPRRYELDLGWHLASAKAWKYCNCYPRAGLMLNSYDFDSPEVLGKGYGFVPYIEPFLSAEKTFSVSLKAGVGVVYLDNSYHPQKNPENHFYSTDISFVLLANAAANYRITPDLNLRLSANYNHISNGSIKQPNKGINFPTASLGVDYSFNYQGFPEREKEAFQPEAKHNSRVRISPFFTFKEAQKSDERQFAVVGLSTKYSRFVSWMNAFTAGLDWVWDESLKEKIRTHNLKNTAHNRIAITAGHELHIGKINFYQQMGVYIFVPYKAMDPVYQRYGLEYSFGQYIAAGVNLKAHRHVADFLDFRISLSL